MMVGATGTGNVLDSDATPIVAAVPLGIFTFDRFILLLVLVLMLVLVLVIGPAEAVLAGAL